MWLESEAVFCDLVPGGVEFIPLPRIRPHEVLKNTRRSNRHLIVLDSSVFVVHSLTLRFREFCSRAETCVSAESAKYIIHGQTPNNETRFPPGGPHTPARGVETHATK